MNEKDIKSIIRSDTLPDLRKVIARVKELSELGSPLQVNLIVDTNIIIEDILWLSRRRKDPQARTQLQEVMDAETAVIYSPTYLIKEVETIIPQHAEKYSIPQSELEFHWAYFRERIQFIDAGGPVEGVRDPKDFPFLALQEKIKAKILTRDGDIESMGGDTVPVFVIAQLQSYSRDAAVSYHLKITEYGAIYITSAMIVKALELFKVFAPKAKKLPPWICAGGIMLFLVAMLHPTSRKKFLDGFKMFSGATLKAGKALLEILEPLILEQMQAECEANKVQAEIEEILSIR